jgi:group II intron reverse transcriptase/maturase
MSRKPATDGSAPGASGKVVMEEAVVLENWRKALAAVVANRGAPGPDGMRTSELAGHLDLHGGTIVRKLLEGRYRPAAARRVEIPKASGGTRGLNVPNVVDRFVQQLLLQVLTPRLDPQMSASSYGFRPGRSAHQAVQQAQEYARAGFDWVVDLDIEKFFDRVNHDVLMHRLSREVEDRRVLHLIGQMLRAGHILPCGDVKPSEMGTPQGGPLSPLLANLYLDALDQELTRRGLKFCRYADDCNIYMRSRSAAERVAANVTTWLQRHLKLTVNASKSGVGRAWERKFLGFTLTLTLLIAIATSSLSRYQDMVREHYTGRGGGTTVQLRDAWLPKVRGWWSYYRLAEYRQPLADLSGWTRRHMRKCFWQRWHSSAGRYRHLRRLGLSHALAKAGYSTRGAWRMASNGAMNKALSNARLQRFGFLVPTDLG